MRKRYVSFTGIIRKGWNIVLLMLFLCSMEKLCTATYAVVNLNVLKVALLKLSQLKGKNMNAKKPEAGQITKQLIK
jgi:hypothetical protein